STKGLETQGAFLPLLGFLLCGIAEKGAVLKQKNGNGQTGRSGSTNSQLVCYLFSTAECSASLLRIAARRERCRWKGCRNLAKGVWGRMLSAFLRGKGDSYAVRGALQAVSLVVQPGMDKMQRVRAGHSDRS